MRGPRPRPRPSRPGPHSSDRNTTCHDTSKQTRSSSSTTSSEPGSSPDLRSRRSACSSAASRTATEKKTTASSPATFSANSAASTVSASTTAPSPACTCRHHTTRSPGASCAQAFHEVPGGFQIHDYGDYQETTLSRQMRRVRNAQRQRKRRSPECHTHVTRDTGVTDTHPSSARASDPGFKPLSTISGSDHSVGADESKNLLRTADYGPDLERLRQIAADLRGADPKTPIVLGSVLRGQPEAVLAAALERVEARRRKTHLGPIANEAKYLVATVREVIAERGSAAA